MKLLCALLLASVSACAADETFTFTLEVEGITDETVTVDGAAQTPAAGAVVITQAFDSWYDTRDPRPAGLVVVVTQAGQPVATQTFIPGLSCASYARTWETETATITLGGAAPQIRCLCTQGSNSLDGTCPVP